MDQHPVSKSKARFRRLIGFSESNADVLERGLCSIAQPGEVVEIMKALHGTKYIVDGQIQTPNGIPVEVGTIWIIDAGEDTPRFVTAYPK